MVTLRTFEESDIERVQALADNPLGSKFMTHSFPSPYTKADAEWWVRTGSRKDGYHRAVEFEGELVGGIGAIPQAAEYSRMATIGYWLGQPFWGKGIDPEALRLHTEWMFEHTDIIRLGATVYGPNEGSMRVLDKCGYERGGSLERPHQT
ncbi:MAG: GNAT family N-acetyltransferase [Verrucomicrobiota bacterium]